MMNILESELPIKTLTQLGLTSNQAKAYLALVKSGPTTAPTIANNSGITRQDIYRVMPSLQEMGFVEKEFYRPSIYNAIPIKQILQILLSQRRNETVDIKNQIGTIIEKISTKKRTNGQKEKKLETIFITGNRPIINKVQNSIKLAKKSILCITSGCQMARILFEVMNTDLFKVKNCENIKVRIVTEKIGDVTITPLFEKYTNFELNFVRESPEAHLMIFDNKEILIKISTSGIFAETPSLWSTNPCLVAIGLNYFETLWNKSISFINPDANTMNRG